MNAILNQWLVFPLIAWIVPLAGFLYYRYLLPLTKRDEPVSWRLTAPLLVSLSGMTFVVAWSVFDQRPAHHPVTILIWSTTIVLQLTLLTAVACAASWNAKHTDKTV